MGGREGSAARLGSRAGVNSFQQPLPLPQPFPAGKVFSLRFPCQIDLSKNTCRREGAQGKRQTQLLSCNVYHVLVSKQVGVACSKATFRLDHAEPLGEGQRGG